MITLGMDPSLTAFGWCVHDSSAVGPERVIARGRFATDTKAVFVTRYMELREKVVALIDEYPQIEGIGVESSVFGEQYSEGLYGLYLYVAEAIYVRRKDVVYFDPGRVKLLTMTRPIKNKKMFKSDMVAAAKADTGAGPKVKFNHNEADAYHIARFAARFWEFMAGKITKDDLTPAELHVFTHQHTFVKGKNAGKTERTGVMFKEGERFFRFSKLPETK